MMDSRALRTFLPETAIKMMKSCHPRGGAREAGAADGVEIAANLDRRSMAAAARQARGTPTGSHARLVRCTANEVTSAEVRRRLRQIAEGYDRLADSVGWSRFSATAEG